ncbi:TonB-dependent receptor plug domain-containing protein [Flavobacterium luteum]|uniref:TonB-dependent receptor n=1 Tax=Flavobacterium luteum TaxID=2026654 RepID=A0A7J5AFB3_9FLAO|nr:TonB-dependent receptor [Flavobacterium luteum]KAB1156287.1 TonB-dependent receptor [Flavobacterium luteum]
MTLRKQLMLLLLFMCQFILGQTDSIVLKEVNVTDSQLKKFSNSKSILKINDSVIFKNRSSLTSLLNFNSTIYFKENGLGMVSSPSFRGTTAQQTAVVWNGININSQLNGLTDFNTINSSNYNSITIRAGGGSSIYGSSAIGGSIHLNNDLNFENEFSNNLLLRYGSFNTQNLDYLFKASTKKLSSQFSVSRNSSDNDFDYLGTNKKNENGQFYNTSTNFNFGYKLNATNFIKFYNQIFDGERHFSGTLAAGSKSKYQDFNTRSLIEFSNFYKNTISNVRLAYLTEEYNYFEDKDLNNFSYGKSETAIAKYDFSYQLNKKINFNTLIDYTRTIGFGSDLKENKRQIVSGIFLMKHQLTDAFLYELNFRNEITSNYKSPVLYAFGANYKVSKIYTSKFNFSKNFRIPTFNDLYYQAGGNENLKPESAYQLDLIQEITVNNLVFSISGFFNKITDMISWKPNDSGLWQPINTNKVKTYGVETHLRYDKQISKNQAIQFVANYGYTISENEMTKKQLIYVPYHKLTSNAAYSYRKITFYFNYLFNGQVFTSFDNKYKLKEYTVVNSGIEYQFLKSCKLGFQVQNIFNEKYQNVEQRPLPGRNYTVNFNFNL